MVGLTDDDYLALEEICSKRVFRNVGLDQISRWRIGGHADILVEPTTIDELRNLRAYINRRGLPSVTIGETTNLLFSDEGLRAIAIRIGPWMSDCEIDGRHVCAQAGIWVPYLARRIMRAGLTGAEHVCGIPGTLGGLVCMNGGSQRKGIGDSVLSVTTIDPEGGVSVIDHAGCHFGYRKSEFQGSDAIIASIALQFDRAPCIENVRREMLAILRARRGKFPREKRNCGSVFKSDPDMYADLGPPGKVIEEMGFKGYRIGGAMVSLEHGNFFVNLGTATAAEMVMLICDVRDAVLSKTGHCIRSEVRYVSSLGDVTPVDAVGQKP